MDIFSDQTKEEIKNRVELARKAIADAGGPAIGSAAHRAKEKQAAIDARQRDSAYQQTLTALQIRMQDPAYAAAYERCWTLLEDVQSRLDAAIIQNAEDIEAMEANAARLGSGTMMFRRADGRLCYADGSEVPSDEVPDHIPDDAPSWDEYRAAKKRQAHLARIQSDTLDPIYGRMQDQDNPPSQDDLDGFIDDLQSIDTALDSSASLNVPTVKDSAPSREEIKSTFSGGIDAPSF